MPDPLLLAFVGVAFLVTLTPGADMALVGGVAMRHGSRLARFAGWGAATGLLIHGLAAAIGLSALLVGSATLFAAVKIVGAVYLIWIGARGLWSALRGDSAATTAAAGDALTPARAFARGVLTNVLNPKIAVFYLAFLPQFADPAQPFLPRALLLSSIHAAMNYAWLPLYAVGMARVGTLARGAARRVVEGAAGTVLVLIGARLLLAQASSE